MSSKYPLHGAALGGDIDEVKFLISNGADINKKYPVHILSLSLIFILRVLNAVAITYYCVGL